RTHAVCPYFLLKSEFLCDCDIIPIKSGSPNVFFGSSKTQVAEIAEEFSPAQQAFIVAVEMGFPPSRRGIKNGLGKIRLGIDDFSKGVKDTITKEKKFRRCMVEHRKVLLRDANDPSSDLDAICEKFN
ncbi:hypothetical protein, partial [Rodentibacter ratti]|uniref:hypothetical protein n=1 Tax=Rodentibacter ratti TaxID=1906745 RepID=UPI001C5B24DA